MSSPTPSCSPTPASRDVKELSKQLEIARKRQEAEHAARLRRQEEKERRKREEKEQKEREEAARKEAEAKVQRDREEAEKRVRKEKGKDKVRGTSVGRSVLLTDFVQEIVVLTLDDDMVTCMEPVPCKVRHYTQMSELPPTPHKWNPPTQKG